MGVRDRCLGHGLGHGLGVFRRSILLALMGGYGGLRMCEAFTALHGLMGLYHDIAFLLTS
jgi:hypothetical protein